MTQWLGIDTGLNTAIAAMDGDRPTSRGGRAAVVALRTVPHPKGDLPVQYAALRRGIQVAVGGLRPDVIAVEQPEDAVRKGRTARAVLVLFGAFAVACAELGRIFPRIPIIGVTPGQWKGGMTKMETQRILQLRHPDAKPANEHEWDALGVADWLADIWRNDKMRTP